MSLRGAEFGQYGGSWIVPNGTTTPETGNWWCKLQVISAMEVTAISGDNADGTHGTKTWAAGAEVTGHFTSITCSSTQAGGLIWGVYGRPTP